MRLGPKRVIKCPKVSKSFSDNETSITTACLLSSKGIFSKVVICLWGIITLLKRSCARVEEKIISKKGKQLCTSMLYVSRARLYDGNRRWKAVRHTHANNSKVNYKSKL